MAEEELENFELFKGGNRTYQAKVSIRKNAQIAISSGAARRFGFRNDKDRLQYEYFLLYYNDEDNQIGLSPVEDPKDGVVKARDHSSGEIQLACKSFLDRYGIPYEETKRFPIGYDEELGLYIIELGEYANS